MSQKLKHFGRPGMLFFFGPFYSIPGCPSHATHCGDLCSTQVAGGFSWSRWHLRTSNTWDFSHMKSEQVLQFRLFETQQEAKRHLFKWFVCESLQVSKLESETTIWPCYGHFRINGTVLGISLELRDFGCHKWIGFCDVGCLEPVENPHMNEPGNFDLDAGRYSFGPGGRGPTWSTALGFVRNRCAPELTSTKKALHIFFFRFMVMNL